MTTTPVCQDRFQISSELAGSRSLHVAIRTAVVTYHDENELKGRLSTDSEKRMLQQSPRSGSQCSHRSPAARREIWMSLMENPNLVSREPDE